MTEESLLQFMKRILECGSVLKSRASLNQLKEILEAQNADPEMVRLVTRTLTSLPEAKAAAKEPELTEENLRTAIQRGEARIRRAEGAAVRGRC